MRHTGIGASGSVLSLIWLIVYLRRPEMRDPSNSEQSAEMLRRYARRRTWWYRWLRPPDPFVLNPREHRLPEIRRPLLFVGGAGASLPSEYINLDSHAAPGVTVVGDVERLPFLDAAIGSASCDAVLEHVRDPQRAVAELLRVLKPGAHLHVGVPFCHPFHAYPSDYRRWTRAGFEELLQEFELIHVGVRTGPTATMLAFLLEYAKLLAPTALRRPVHLIVGWSLWPARYLDYWMMRHEQAHILANNFYALVRKPLDDGSASE